MVRDPVLSPDLTPVLLGPAHAGSPHLLAQLRTLIRASLSSLPQTDGVPYEASLRHMADHAEGNLQRWCADPSGQHLHLMVQHASGEPAAVLLVLDHWALCSLFVAPAWQGQGVGRWLMAQAISLCCHRTDRPMLRLVASPGAEGFYQRMGFRRVRSLQALPVGFVSMGRAWSSLDILDAGDVMALATSRFCGA